MLLTLMQARCLENPCWHCEPQHVLEAVCHVQAVHICVQACDANTKCKDLCLLNESANVRTNREYFLNMLVRAAWVYPELVGSRHVGRLFYR